MSKILHLIPNSFQEILSSLPKKLKNDDRLHDGHKIVYFIVDKDTKDKKKNAMTRSLSEIASNIGVSGSMVSDILKDLIELGYVYKIGNNTKAFWITKNEEEFKEEPNKIKKDIKTPNEIFQSISSDIKKHFINETNLYKILAKYDIMSLKTLRGLPVKSYKFGTKKMYNKKEFLDFLKEVLKLR